MKLKTDWVVIAAALGIGCLVRVMLTSDVLILPAFIAVIMLHCVATRIARHS